jgi:endoglucanase
VQEEVGDFAGSRTVAFATEPDLAVAIDVTHTTDVRGADPEDEGKVVLGGGPTISRGPSIHEDVFELLYDVAEAEGIPFAVEVSPRGTTWTDADAIYLSRSGVATGLVSVPLRYMHSPVEMLDLEDLERAVQLVVAFARRLEPGMSFTG